MKRTTFNLILILVFGTVSVQPHELRSQPSAPLNIESSPEEIGNRVVANIVDRYFGWRYQKACTYYGALIFADATGNESITRQMQEGFRPYYEGKRKPHRGHVDYNVFGIWPFELYRQTGDERYLQIARDLADHEYMNPGPDGLPDLARFWVDDMYMVGSLQVQAFKSTGDRLYLHRAAHFLQVYVDTLQRSNGLFHHREDAPFFWGRGNGWAVAALTEVLLVLPEDHEYMASLLDAFQKMMSTLATHQGADGMWHQLIDDSESFPESSSTGMFLYGFISGVDKGWLPMETYRETIENGWEALASYVNDKGEAMNVCIGTNAKNRKKHYLTRPKTDGNFHGQAAVLWASTALVRSLEGSK
jgi:rhamnogalacturonyl hydrolase YesR